MNLPGNLFSIAFRRQRLGLMLSFLIGIMVYLGSLAMAAQAVLARTSYVWGQDIQNRLTVEVPAKPGETPQEREQRILDAANFLSKRKDVSAVTVVPEAETARLLKPWVVDAAFLDSLALPRLIDVDVVLGRGLDVEAVKQGLKPFAGGGVRILRHEEGMAQLLGFLKGLGFLAALMLLLTGLSIVTIIGVICRAAMAAQRETIELLHFMGASDSVIAAQFRAHVRKLSLPAALIGFFCAAGTVGALAFMLGSLGGLSLVSPVSWITVGGVMALVPFAATGLSLLAARLSVLGLLRRLV